MKEKIQDHALTIGDAVFTDWQPPAHEGNGAATDALSPEQPELVELRKHLATVEELLVAARQKIEMLSERNSFLMEENLLLALQVARLSGDADPAAIKETNAMELRNGHPRA